MSAGVVSPVFIGRREELTALTALLGQAADGVPAVALIGGEASAGKTRLVSELEERPDQLQVQRALHGWEWQAADPPGTLRPWRPGEYLRAGIHDIWCRPRPRSALPPAHSRAVTSMASRRRGVPP
jgi:hypothetical protein